MIQSLILFVISGLFEIGGGYLVWLTLREGKTAWFAVIGVILLGFYGAVPTLQPTNFGRAYAAYGGVFVVLSIFWGWFVDRVVPDKFDYFGGWMIILGVLVMMYAPRS
ncbi:MAG: YnfA family protein [Limnothrix sp. CACIAM 69d]|jgi:small multidrug resistance family-3 protein|nr:MAG: YnfA family protein [Limnothrix sp. CACIAM 69d]